ncbi:hypothetical protein WT71_16285 [Burkholderia stagnalis]|nr:hypothetical protein WT71_16285 [Burkholderia stagnalis]KWI71007.1 hypothetical protein WT73_14070 [Burkholderia stagnalis]
MDALHFDTLWSTAQDALTVYANKRWSARGDGDPGVTLLQALSFGVSDMSYRHTLPLTDLLTPSPDDAKNHETDDEGSLSHDGQIFAKAFGPETALTCGPVTLDDYRRAILDLSMDDTSSPATLLFRDVQIAKIANADDYQYQYDPNNYSFGFVGNGHADHTFKVAGRYRLWVTCNPGVTEDVAGTRLTEFLKRHRNLCEWEITDIKYPAWNHSPRETDPNTALVATVELADDLPNEQVAEVVARAIWAANDVLLPWATRQPAQTRLDQNERAEAIYWGPKLEHGWLATLPSARGVDDKAQLVPRSVELSDLTAAMEAVPGVKRVAWSGGTQFKISADCQGLLWFNPYWGALENGVLGKALVVRKRGQPAPYTEEVVNSKLIALWALAKLVNRDPSRSVAYGQYRQPSYYRTAGSWLPPVYGLQQGRDTFQDDWPAQQLIRFLRPFEQQVADCGDLLERLPRLLAFDGRAIDAAVWGAADWPKPAEDGLADEQTDVAIGKAERDTLLKESHAWSIDHEKELQILDYLLGYFGERRSYRTLLKPGDDEFRVVQQGFLRQVTRLAYDRAAISISKISALQRRIAARLGIGQELFDEAQEKENASFPKALPFYLIEHQELLPVAPDPKAFVSDRLADQTVKDASPNNDSKYPILTLTLANPNHVAFKEGQLIELQATRENVGDTLEPITAIVIHHVKSSLAADPAILEIALNDHVRLQRSLTILRDVANHTWRWRLGQNWLKRLAIDVEYDQGPDAASLLENEKRLKISGALPVDLVPGTRLAWRPKARWLLVPTPADLSDSKIKDLPDYVVEVVAVDRVGGTVTVKWVTIIKNGTQTKGNVITVLPINVDAAKETKPAEWPDLPNLYAWSIPYSGDAFAFTMSVVLNREWLQANGNPAELDQWIQQIVRDEVPSHLNVQVCWLSAESFHAFASRYRTWQDKGRPVGDQSYELLRLLGIGERPTDRRAGIGFVQVATDEVSQKLEKTRDAAPDKDNPSPSFEKEYQNNQIVYVAGEGKAGLSLRPL